MMSIFLFPSHELTTHREMMCNSELFWASSSPAPYLGAVGDKEECAEALRFFAALNSSAAEIRFLTGLQALPRH